MEDTPTTPTGTPPQPDQRTSNNQALTTMASTPLSLSYTSICLLKTAIANVSSTTTTAEGNILFDEGAQRSFITQKLADELQLQPTHQEIISMSSFGAQVSSSRSLAVVTMFVHTLNDSLIPISVLIIPKLAAPIRNSVRTHLRSIPYLQKLPLAHPVTGDENFEISVLIGAGNLYKIILFEVMDQLQLNHSLAISCLVLSLCLNLLRQLLCILRSFPVPPTRN